MTCEEHSYGYGTYINSKTLIKIIATGNAGTADTVDLQYCGQFFCG